MMRQNSTNLGTTLLGSELEQVLIGPPVCLVNGMRVNMAFSLLTP